MELVRQYPESFFWRQLLKNNLVKSRYKHVGVADLQFLKMQSRNYNVYFLRCNYRNDLQFVRTHRSSQYVSP